MYRPPKLLKESLYIGSTLGICLKEGTWDYLNIIFGTRQEEVTYDSQVSINRKLVPHLITDAVHVPQSERIKMIPELDIWWSNFVEYSVNKDLKVFGFAKARLQNLLEHNYSIGAAYNVDRFTTVKGKIEDDCSMTVSVIHNYRDIFNFGFIAKLAYQETTKEIPTKQEFSYFKYKFGVELEINDTLDDIRL